MESVAMVMVRLRDEAGAGLHNIASAASGAAQATEELEGAAKAAEAPLAGVGDSAEQTAEQLAEAAEAARRAAEEMAGAGEDAGSAGHGFDEGATGADRLGSVSETAGRSVQKLAGAIGIASPAASEWARNVADVADVGEVAAQSMKALGISLTQGLMVLGPIAVAVGVLAVAYKVLAAEAEAAAAKVERSTAAEIAAQATHEKMAAGRLSANDKYRLGLGLVTEAELAARDAGIAAAESYAPKIAEMEQAAADLGAQAAALQAESSRFLVGAEGHATPEALRLQDEAASKLRQQAALERELAGVRGQSAEAQGQAIIGTTLLALKGEEAGKSADKLAVSHERVVKALTAEEEAAKRLSATEKELAAVAAAFDAEAFMPAAPGAFASLANELDGLVPPKALTDLEQLADLGARVKEAFGMGQIDAAQYDALTAAVARGVETTAAAQAAAAKAEAAPADTGAQGVANTAVGFAQSPMATIGSSTGPWGAVIVGAMQAVTHLDETLGGLKSWGEDFREALKTAPQEILDFILAQLQAGDPIMDIVSMVQEFVVGFIKGIPEMMKAMAADIGPMAGEFVKFLVMGVPEIVVAFFEMLFDGQMWLDAGKELLKGFAEGFDDLFAADPNAPTPKEAAREQYEAKRRDLEWWGQAGKDVGDFFSKGESEHFATGADYVTKPGMKWLDAGETVVNRTGASSQRTAQVMKQGGQGGGDSHVHMGGMGLGSVQDLARAVRRELTGRRIPGMS